MAREARNNAELTEKQKNENYNKHIASVEVLEAELLEHSIARDELQGALQRLDSTRTRSVADRARKVTVERQLEEEERMIGHIRLQIRNLGR
ncbi:hypothetical protein AGDE_15399 [Angomonas deanei]|uniref:Uncharacterized protein n=1 Tax=Angomonas deanei TaxID=59799 RepID=A0A7G2CGM8_9TRYP|nr:hypothetical protein AGDE_15399 [Angomonas deanei]CAD2218131.1 hypothetical protein, conserved [Angomonas deanei]|eukprot:EPY19152.1 hypothetical protein AGDE_15399 [Angomonas deanei]